MTWMQTYTGKAVFPLEIQQHDIDIVDIAHSLSNQCRFAGHCLKFYSVAEHCVRASHCVNPQTNRNQLGALLHDASEAYLVDLPRPVKMQILQYALIEEQVMRSIEKHFGIVLDSRAIHNADETMLATERRDLMSDCKQPWGLTHRPLPEVIEPWSPAEAKAAFLNRFHNLYEG